MKSFLSLSALLLLAMSAAALMVDKSNPGIKPTLGDDDDQLAEPCQVIYNSKKPFKTSRTPSFTLQRSEDDDDNGFVTYEGRNNVQVVFFDSGDHSTTPTLQVKNPSKKTYQLEFVYYKATQSNKKYVKTSRYVTLGARYQKDCTASIPFPYSDQNVQSIKAYVTKPV
jgi:hypothetical protein